MNINWFWYINKLFIIKWYHFDCLKIKFKTALSMILIQNTIIDAQKNLILPCPMHFPKNTQWWSQLIIQTSQVRQCSS